MPTCLLLGEGGSYYYARLNFHHMRQLPTAEKLIAMWNVFHKQHHNQLHFSREASRIDRKKYSEERKMVCQLVGAIILIHGIENNITLSSLFSSHRSPLKLGLVSPIEKTNRALRKRFVEPDIIPRKLDFTADIQEDRREGYEEGPEVAYAPFCKSPLAAWDSEACSSPSKRRKLKEQKKTFKA